MSATLSLVLNFWDGPSVSLVVIIHGKISSLHRIQKLQGALWQTLYKNLVT